MIELTVKRINKGKSPRGGIRACQLLILGEVRSKGWFKRLLGKKVHEYQYSLFLELRDPRTRKQLNSKGKSRHLIPTKPSKHRIKYYQYLASEEWAQIKLDLYQLRGKKCEVCDSKQNIQVHHLTYKNVFNEEPEDLILLCKKCHEKEHGK
jgi:5-methylcytosine-specific restriction endonuclease McrA